MSPHPLPPFHDTSLLQRALTHRSYVNEHREVLEDNERLEFLGDAVLDFISGAFAYQRYPEMREGQLTRLRSALVRTEQLAAFAQALELGAQVLLGRGEEESGGRQRASLLADTFEALIGAYYMDTGVEAVRAYVEPLLEASARQILRDETHHDAKSQLQEWSQSIFGAPPRYVLVSATGPDHSKAFTVEVFVDDESYGIGTGPSKQAAERAAAEAALRRAGLT